MDESYFCFRLFASRCDSVSNDRCEPSMNWVQTFTNAGEEKMKDFVYEHRVRDDDFYVCNLRVQYQNQHFQLEILMLSKMTVKTCAGVLLCGAHRSDQQKKTEKDRKVATTGVHTRVRSLGWS